MSIICRSRRLNPELLTAHHPAGFLAYARKIALLPKLVNTLISAIGGWVILSPSTPDFLDSHIPQGYRGVAPSYNSIGAASCPSRSTPFTPAPGSNRLYITRRTP